MPRLFVPTPGAVRVELGGVIDLKPQFNHLVFQFNTTTPNFFDMFALGNGLMDWWREHFRPILSGDFQSVGAQVARMNTEFDLLYNTAPSPINSGLGGPCLPNNCGLRVDFLTGVPGRAFHGCNTVPGIAQNNVQRSLLDPFIVGLIQAAYDELLTRFTSLGWTWVVHSRRFEGAVRTVGVVTPITSVVIKDRVIDSMRSRIIGRTDF